jgi:hypothetical protein
VTKGIENNQLIFRIDFLFNVGRSMFDVERSSFELTGELQYITIESKQRGNNGEKSKEHYLRLDRSILKD